MELDVVAESRDGKAVLIGEAKAKNLPFVRGRAVVPVLWAKRGQDSPGVRILTPDAVLDGLQ